MCTLYESILSLCLERGITGGKMCVDLDISKSLMSDLKSGRKKGITSETARKIADYFDVSVDRVLGNEKKPTPVSESGPKFPPTYELLTPENRAKADSYLEFLLASQQSD